MSNETKGFDCVTEEEKNLVAACKSRGMSDEEAKKAVEALRLEGVYAFKDAEFHQEAKK